MTDKIICQTEGCSNPSEVQQIEKADVCKECCKKDQDRINKCVEDTSKEFCDNCNYSKKKYHDCLNKCCYHHPGYLDHNPSMIIAKFIGETHSSKSRNLHRWECPTCRENLREPECRFNLDAKRINTEWRCRFCKRMLFLKKT